MNQTVIDELKKYVGDKNVLTQPGDLFLYSFDSAFDRALPSAVVLPKTPEQVALVVRVLAKNKIPYVARGAATSLCGGPVPLQNAVVVSLARLNAVGKIEKEKMEVLVEPGVINLRLQHLAEKEGLFYPPDPGSQKACTIGGNVGTNAGGPHCLKYGVTSHFVNSLDIVLPDGQMLTTKVSDPGYDLTGFFVGSEGTLGIVSRVRLKLLPKPAFVKTMLVSFASVEEAIQSVTDIIGAGLLPATLEAMDKTTVAAVEAFVHAGYPLDAEAVLLIEVDGDRQDELDRQVIRIQELCQINRSSEFRFAKDEKERLKLWEGRRGSYAALARLAPNVLVEDGAVPRTKLPEALKQIKQIAEESDLRVALLFHAGDGNLHPQIIFDERDVEHTKTVKEAGYKMLKVCVDLGGTISGEHGIGADKREAMKWLFTRETLALFRRLKNAFDPDNLCNPDKLIPLVSNTKAVSPTAVPPVPEKKEAPKVSADGIITPASEAALVEQVREFAKQKTHFGVQGSASKYRVRDNMIVQTTNLNQILDFDKGNLTLSVQSGVTIDQIQSVIEKENQFLWVQGKGTIGGIVATRSSVVPPIRDLLLGMRLLLPNGDIVQLGAKTMKNVAGYDVPKLLIGSWGTLAIILDVTFRLFPYAAPQIKSTDPRPFAFKDIHKKIKRAFDPDNVFSQRMTVLTKEEAAAPPDMTTNPLKGRDDLQNLADKFWL